MRRCGSWFVGMNSEIAEIHLKGKRKRERKGKEKKKREKEKRKEKREKFYPRKKKKWGRKESRISEKTNSLLFSPFPFSPSPHSISL